MVGNRVARFQRYDTHAAMFNQARHEKDGADSKMPHARYEPRHWIKRPETAPGMLRLELSR
jgi:hypothetical protein